MAIVQGTAYWASIKTPNTKFVPTYTINLVVDEDTASDFKSRGFKIKDMNEGPALIITRKVTGKSGRPNSVPRLVDSQKQDINVTVGNGSLVNVMYKEWSTVRDGETFKGLDLQGVQVLNLVEAGGSADSDDDFDVVDNNPFGD